MKRLLVFLFFAAPALAQDNVSSSRFLYGYFGGGQTNTFCAANLACTVTGAWSFTTGAVTIGNGNSFTPFTFSNHNAMYWAGPGATPTIDQAVTACGANPCFVTISPLYTGPESANLFTTSTTYKVYNGPSNVTIEDLRSGDSGSGSPAGTPMYPITYGGRSDGELARMGINGVCNSPNDSCVGAADYVWFRNNFPANGGAIMAASSVAILSDTVTIGTPATVSPVIGRDGEVWLDALTIDRSLPYAAAFSGQASVNRGNSTQHTVTATGYSAPNCADIVGGLINTCYGYDSSCCTNGIQGNYGYHSSGSWLTEINTSFDFTDGGNPVTTTSMVTTTATYNTTGVCLFVTGQKVLISGVATIAGGSYNGIYPVLAGCSGGTSFTVTLPFSGLGASSGGNVRGIHTGTKWQSSDSSINYFPMLDSIGWNWKRNSDSALVFQVTSAGAFVKGQLNPTVAAASFLGQGSFPWAGLILGTGTNLSYTLNPVSPASNRTINITDMGIATTTMTQTVASGTVVMTTALIATVACGTTVTVAATGVLTTDTIDIAHNAAVTAANGGLLTLNAWPTAGNVNFNYCNPTGVGQTPTAMTVNWSVRRP